MFNNRQFGDLESNHALLDLPRCGDGETVTPMSTENIGSGHGTSPSASQLESDTSTPLPNSSSSSTRASFSLNDHADFTFTKRLGWYLLLTNIGGLVLLLGAISALSFLWFGDENNIRWRHIMINGWLGQAVTLSTLAIRLAVTTQASTAVAMLAAISLESIRSTGAPLAAIPPLSLSRYINTGPITSVPAFWSSSRLLKSGFVLPSITLLATCALTAQFTSTILFWDVRSGIAHGFPHTTNPPVGMDMAAYINRFWRYIDKGQNYWMSSPQTFLTFAEWNTKPSVHSNLSVDTGPTIRAFLLINSQADRSMVIDYHGDAAVFDARVACVRPTFNDWTFTKPIDGHNIPLEYFTGFARPRELTDEIAHALRYNSSGPGIPFRCRYDDMDIHADPMFKICLLDYSAGGLINILDHSSNTSLHHFFNNETASGMYATETDVAWVARSNDSTTEWPVEMGHTFLLFHSKGNSTDGPIADFGSQYSTAQGNSAPSQTSHVSCHWTTQASTLACQTSLCILVWSLLSQYGSARKRKRPSSTTHGRWLRS